MNYAVNLGILTNYMKENKVSKREVARRMKIDNSYLVRILEGERSPGMKFINGLYNLGFDIKDIFEKSSKKKLIDDTDIDQCVCDYMNAMAVGYEKEYKLEEVKDIKRSIYCEREDRKVKNIIIKGHTVDGRKHVNERTVVIAKEEFKLNVTARDINLYKKCRDLEVKERRLINDLEDDDEGVI